MYNLFAFNHCSPCDVFFQDKIIVEIVKQRGRRSNVRTVLESAKKIGNICHFIRGDRSYFCTTFMVRDSITQALQDLDQQINTIESSSNECLERSSQLLRVLSEMSFNSVFQNADYSHQNELNSLQIDSSQINQAPTKLIHVQQSTSSEKVDQSECDNQFKKPLTKLQQMLLSSNLSSNFVSDKSKNERIQQLLPSSRDFDQVALEDPIDPNIQQSDFPTNLAQVQNAATDSSAGRIGSANDTFHHQQVTMRHSAPQITHVVSAEISDGPSQRAASLLLSRSSAIEPRSSFLDLKQLVSVKLQHWDGSDICNDP
jgi:hypothetical protein